MDHDKSSNIDQTSIDSLTGVFAAIVAPARRGGAAADLQLPRTRQDVEETTIQAKALVSDPVAPINTLATDNRGLPLALEETSRRAQASASHPRVTNTTTTSVIRKDNPGSPLSERTLDVDEPHEKQKNSRNPQDSKPNLHVDIPKQDDEKWPLKWPIAPQHCRRFGKPQRYVVFEFSMKLSDGMCG